MNYVIYKVYNNGKREIIATAKTPQRAIKTARKAVASYEGDIADAPYQVFIRWHRSEDDQTGYLNPDGDHAIVGKAFVQA